MNSRYIVPSLVFLILQHAVLLADAAAEEEGAYTFFTTDNIIITILALALVIGIAIYFRQKLQELGGFQEEIATTEVEFAEELIRSVERTGAPVAGVAAPPAQPAAAASAFSTPALAKHFPGHAQPATGSGNSSPVEDLARRLSGLQIVTEMEGRVPLAAPPDGLIYRLRAGGSCVLLPRLESEDAMSHFVRRFDLVFVLTHSDEVLVLERLQNRVPKMLDAPSDFRMPR